MAALFGEQQPLIVHRLCTDSSASSLPHAHDANECWAGIARHLKQRVAFAMVARSSIARILAYGRERRWNNLKLCSNPGGACTRDYVSAEAEDMPVCSVFHRTDGAIRHFWSSEGGSATADPGQNPHGAPDRSALWTLLDTTPEGCGNNRSTALDDERANPLERSSLRCA